MAVKRPPTFFLLCGPASTTKAVLVESVKEEFGVEVISVDGVNARRGYAIGDPRVDGVILDEAVEVILFEIITAGMSDQSIAIDVTSGDQSTIDRYIANAKSAGMKVEVLTS